MNEAHFTGRLTREVSLGQTSTGKPCAFYVIAVETRSPATDEIEVDFIPVTSYGRQAENDARYLHKGRTVTVKARVRSWWDPIAKRGGFHFNAITVQYHSGVSSKPVAEEPQRPLSLQEEMALWQAQADARFEQIDREVQKQLAAAGQRDNNPAN